MRMVHILLKTLENYSKSNDYMYVRKKRTIAKKKSEKAATEGKDLESKNTAYLEILSVCYWHDPVVDTCLELAQITEAQANGDLPQAGQLNLGDDGEGNGQEQEQDEEEAEENEQTHTMSEHKFLFSEYERVSDLFLFSWVFTMAVEALKTNAELIFPHISYI